MGCEGCWEKQQKIDRLSERIEELERKLACQRRKENEGYFGSSTPSSKKPFKRNSTTAQTNHKNGGGREGHLGHGRASVGEGEAESVEYAETPAVCPYCGGEIESKGLRDRSIIDTDSGRAKKKKLSSALPADANAAERP